MNPCHSSVDVVPTLLGANQKHGSDASKDVLVTKYGEYEEQNFYAY